MATSEESIQPHIKSGSPRRKPETSTLCPTEPVRKLKRLINMILKKMLPMKVIKPTQTELASPIVLVSK